MPPATCVTERGSNSGRPTGRPHLFVHGPGRSGTTLLAEILNAAATHRIVFEPFRREEVLEWRQSSDYAHQAIGVQGATPGNDVDETLDFLMLGKIRNSWIDSRGGPDHAAPVLVKAIRAPLMVDYLARRFQTHRFIFILRNPVDTLESQLLLGWNPTLLELFDQGLVERLPPFDLGEIKAMSRIEQLTFMWFAHNYILLTGSRPGTSVFYERLVAGIRPLRRLITDTEAGLSTVHALRARRRRSSTSRERMANQTQALRLSTQDRSYLLNAVKRETQRFGFASLYGDDGMPKCNAPFDWSGPLA